MSTTLPLRARFSRIVTAIAAVTLLGVAATSPLGAQRATSAKPVAKPTSTPTTKPAAKPSAKPTATPVAKPAEPSAGTPATTAVAADSAVRRVPAEKAPEPTPLRAVRESTSTNDAADDTGFREGHLYVGPRVWAGVYGTLAVGVHGEKAIGGPRPELGNGRIGVGASIDMYSYSDGAFGYRWSYRVIPVTGFVNYHVTLKESKLDPYAGIGLGYYMVSTSVDGINTSASSARGSALFLGVQLGARYFVKPNLAVQAQTGVGLGALSLGVTWKR